MGISGLENHAIGDEPVRVRFLYLPKLLLVLLIFLTSCAIAPTKKPCTPEGVHFFVLEGFEVVHESCMGLEAISWKIEIYLCENGEWTKTNLWSFWNGCRYKLIQQNEDNSIDVIGKFKKLDAMKRWLEMSMQLYPEVRIK